MELRISTNMKPDSESKNHVILQILFNEEWVGQKRIEVPEGFTDDSYPTVMKALATAEDSPLYTLYESIERQILEALAMIEVSLPDAYKRVLKLRDNKARRM